MTAQERHLWYDFLKTLPFPVHRQKVIGPYIVDFYCARCKTVIEIDGTQHYLTEGERADKKRDAFLSSQGISVLRYSNAQIEKDFSSVCQDILQHFRFL